MRPLLLFVPLLAFTLAGCSKKAEFHPQPGSIPPVAEQQGVTFAADIKPIFDKTCIECHGVKKQKAGLRLDNAEATIHGSEDGPVFEIGQSATSLLVSNIAWVGIEDDWMPPVDKGKRLSQEQIALIRAWIDQGAK